jgi:hypothetical protein
MELEALCKKYSKDA